MPIAPPYSFRRFLKPDTDPRNPIDDEDELEMLNRLRMIAEGYGGGEDVPVQGPADPYAGIEQFRGQLIGPTPPLTPEIRPATYEENVARYGEPGVTKEPPINWGRVLENLPGKLIELAKPKVYGPSGGGTLGYLQALLEGKSPQEAQGIAASTWDPSIQNQGGILGALNAIPPTSWIPTVVKPATSGLLKLGAGLLGQDVREASRGIPPQVRKYLEAERGSGPVGGVPIKPSSSLTPGEVDNLPITALFRVADELEVGATEKNTARELGKQVASMEIGDPGLPGIRAQLYSALDDVRMAINEHNAGQGAAETVAEFPKTETRSAEALLEKRRKATEPPVSFGKNLAPEETTNLLTPNAATPGSLTERILEEAKDVAGLRKKIEALKEQTEAAAKESGKPDDVVDLLDPLRTPREQWAAIQSALRKPNREDAIRFYEESLKQHDNLNTEAALGKPILPGEEGWLPTVQEAPPTEIGRRVRRGRDKKVEPQPATPASLEEAIERVLGGKPKAVAPEVPAEAAAQPLEQAAEGAAITPEVPPTGGGARKFTTQELTDMLLTEEPQETLQTIRNRGLDAGAGREAPPPETPQPPSGGPPGGIPLSFPETVATSKRTTPSITEALHDPILTYAERRSTTTLARRGVAAVKADADAVERELLAAGPDGWTAKNADDLGSKAYALIGKLGLEGQTQRAVAITELAGRNLLALGRGVQAASMYDRLSPEGILLTATRAIKRAVGERGEGAVSKQLRSIAEKAAIEKAAQTRKAIESQLKEVRQRVIVVRRGLSGPEIGVKTAEELKALRDAAEIAGLDNVVKRADAILERVAKGAPFDEVRQKVRDLTELTSRESSPVKQKAIDVERVMISRAKRILKQEDAVMPPELAESFLERAKKLREMGDPDPGTQSAADKYILQQSLMSDIQNILPPSKWDIFLDALQIPRTLKTMLDLSAMLRQGAVLAPAHPRAWAKSFIPQLKAAIDPDYDLMLDAFVHTRPNAEISEKAGLYLAPRGGSLTTREEFFVSKLARKIPGAAISERAYNTFLNQFRANLFDGQLARWEKMGYAPVDEELKQLSQWINWTTGRGPLGELANINKTLNVTFFAPRFATSRFASLIVGPVRAGMGILGLPGGYSREVSKMVLKDVLTWYATGLSVLAAAKLAGAEVEMDPRSTDFGKIRIGTVRTDFWAGEQQVARFIAQMLPDELGGSQRKTITGNIIDQPRGDTFIRFIRSKLHPVASGLWDLTTGTTWEGNEPFSKPPLEEFLLFIGSISANDIDQVYKAMGPLGLVVFSPLILAGVNIQAYPSPQDIPGAKEYDNRRENASLAVSGDNQELLKILMAYAKTDREADSLFMSRGMSAAKEAMALRSDLAKQIEDKYGKDILKNYNLAVKQFTQGIADKYPELADARNIEKATPTPTPTTTKVPTATKEPTPTSTPTPTQVPRLVGTPKPGATEAAGAQDDIIGSRIAAQWQRVDDQGRPLRYNQLSSDERKVVRDFINAMDGISQKQYGVSTRNLRGDAPREWVFNQTISQFGWPAPPQTGPTATPTATATRIPTPSPTPTPDWWAEVQKYLTPVGAR